MKKTVFWIGLISLCLWLPLQAWGRVVMLEHTENLSPQGFQNKAELTMLGTLRAKHQLVRQISENLKDNPEVRNKVKPDMLEPLAVKLFNLETLNLSGENDAVRIKAKVILDGLLIPEDLNSFLQDQHFSILEYRKHLQHTWSLENDLNGYLKGLAEDRNTRQAESRREQTGTILLKRYSALEKFYNGSDALERSRLREAERYFNEAIELDPNYELAYFMRGMVHVRAQNYDAAVKDFNMGMKLNENDESMRFGRALAYTQQKLFPAKALDDLNLLIKANPDRSRLYMLRAENYFLLNNCYRAREDYNMACNLGYQSACTIDCYMRQRSNQLR